MFDLYLIYKLLWFYSASDNVTVTSPFPKASFNSEAVILSIFPSLVKLQVFGA